MLNAILNAVESGDYASSYEFIRESMSDWKQNREVRLRKESGFKNDILPDLGQIDDGSMCGYSPEKIIERGRQLLAERRVADSKGEEDPWMIRVFLRAIEVFGRSELAAQWLLQPLRRFEGHTSLEMMGTEEGARRVEEMLVQIDEGIHT